MYFEIKTNLYVAFLPYKINFKFNFCITHKINHLPPNIFLLPSVITHFLIDHHLELYFISLFTHAPNLLNLAEVKTQSFHWIFDYFLTFTWIVEKKSRYPKPDTYRLAMILQNQIFNHHTQDMRYHQLHVYRTGDSLQC